MFADKLRKAPEEGEVGPGMLYATGLVAGGSLAGIVIAMLTGFAKPLADKLNLGRFYLEKLGAGSDALGFVMFGLLCMLLLREARAKDA